MKMDGKLARMPSIAIKNSGGMLRLNASAHDPGNADQAAVPAQPIFSRPPM